MTNEKSADPVVGEQGHNWQQRLMPFMIGVILFLTLFFFLATLYQLYGLNERIQQAPQLQQSELLPKAESDAPLVEKQWHSLVVLESHILQQRYHQAKVLLMARIWVQYLGFVTGMMLALIGAIFILGKLREPTTELTLGGEAEDKKLPGNLKMQLVTQSPGIVLVTLGTVLMLITILVHHPIEVTDQPVYTSVTMSGTADGTRTKPAELTLDTTTPPTSTHHLLEQARIRHQLDIEEVNE